MGNLTLNGSTSGSITLTPTAVAGSTTITLPAITGGSFIVSDVNGNVGIGTSTPSQKLSVNGNIYATVASAAFIGGTTTDLCYLKNSDGTSYVQVCGSAKTGDPNVVYIVANTGGVYLAKGGTSWTAVSDERFKENLIQITDATNKVASLRAVTGNYIDDKTKQSKSFLIAQDVQKVLPEAVDTTNESKLGLSYTDVIPLLVAAIQELSAKVTALEAKVGA